MTNWPVQKPAHRTTQKHVAHHDATDIKKKQLFLCFSFMKITYKKPLVEDKHKWERIKYILYILLIRNITYLYENHV